MYFFSSKEKFLKRIGVLKERDKGLIIVAQSLH